MKLYTTKQGHWAGTQADARKLKKKHDTPCEPYEVPVSKQALLAFLNKHRVGWTTPPVDPGSDPLFLRDKARGDIDYARSKPCPSLAELRQIYPTMTDGRYYSYRRGWNAAARRHVE